MNEPIFTYPPYFVVRPDNWPSGVRLTPGQIWMVDSLDDIQVLGPSREWWEPIEDEI